MNCKPGILAIVKAPRIVSGSITHPEILEGMIVKVIERAVITYNGKCPMVFLTDTLAVGFQEGYRPEWLVEFREPVGMYNHRFTHFALADDRLIPLGGVGVDDDVPKVSEVPVPVLCDA